MTVSRLAPHPFRRSLPALFLLLSPLAGAGAQQTATLRVQENLRAEPRGTILGRIQAGVELPVVSLEIQWVRVAVEGWMWTRSLQSTDRLGFDLAVAASPEENLRAEPAGAIRGQLVRGALLERMEEGQGWMRVRRVAWIWRASVRVAGDPADDPAPAPAAPISPPTTRWWNPGVGGAALLTAPDGDTLARTRPGAELQLLAREGNWIRVRLEGWSWAPQEAPDSSSAPVRTGAGPGEVAANPSAFRGQVVSWELQFVSLERAERVRTDFYEGEPFLLARTLPPGSSFVYVAVPPERVGEVEGLIPMERIRVVGRIRTGSAAFTGNPILDLLELTRRPRDAN